MKFLIVTPLLAALVSGRLVFPARSLNLTSRQTANLQTFQGNLGADPLPITESGDANRPFEVNGAAFDSFAAAVQRSCDVQFNQCADEANGGAADVDVDQCQAQKDECSQQGQDEPVTGGTGGTGNGTLPLRTRQRAVIGGSTAVANNQGSGQGNQGAGGAGGQGGQQGGLNGIGNGIANLLDDLSLSPLRRRGTVHARRYVA